MCLYSLPTKIGECNNSFFYFTIQLWNQFEIRCIPKFAAYKTNLWEGLYWWSLYIITIKVKARLVIYYLETYVLYCMTLCEELLSAVDEIACTILYTFWSIQVGNSKVSHYLYKNYRISKDHPIALKEVMGTVAGRESVVLSIWGVHRGILFTTERKFTYTTQTFIPSHSCIQPSPVPKAPA